MAQELYTLSLDSIKYITGLINQIVNLPNDVINNTNLADNLTFSNIHIKNLIDQCLIDANTEAQKLVGALTHLTCKKTTTQPTLGSSELNVIYLYSIDGTPPFQQFLKISDTELIDLGSTSISLNDYLTATEIASTYAKQIDLDTLTDEINNIKNDIGTETMTTTSTTIKSAINELNNKTQDILKKTDITTTIDSTSTDSQVPSAKSVYSAIDNVSGRLNKTTKFTKDNTSYATLEELIKNHDYFKLSKSSIYVFNANGFDDLPSTDWDYTIKMYNTNGAIHIVAYRFISDNEYFVRSFTYTGDWAGGWKRLCTTSVADVDKVMITTQNLTEGIVSYFVKNGICYVSISGITPSLNGGLTIITANTLPLPDTKGNNHYTIGTTSGVVGLFVINNDGSAIFYGQNTVSYFGQFSYPVAES